jgi:hypothetical protein
VQQTILNHLELQLSYRSDDFAAIELMGKQLGYPFVHQLLDTLVQLFGLHRIGIFDILEHFGRKTGQSLEV